MALQRAGVLYPVNTTVVDSGTGRDIRLLSDAQPGATDSSQSATATHTQDNQVRVFDPASAANVSTLTYGWALRVAEDMTPDDDARCNALLPAQTISISLSVSVNQSGGTYLTGTYAPEWRIILAAYNPATDVLTDISGVVGNSGTSWNYTPATGDLGTFKTVTFGATVPQYEFAPGEVLFILIGVFTLAIPNPTLGTATWTYRLAVDDPNTSITFEANKSIRQICRQSAATSGVGIASKGRVTVGKILKATAVGTAAIRRYIRLAAKTAAGAGAAAVRKYVRIAAPKVAVGTGVAGEDNYIRLAAKKATGAGVAAEDNYIRLAAKTAVAVGVATFSKYVQAFRRAVVTASGVAGFARSLIAVRSFIAAAVGIADITNYVRLAAKTAAGLGVATIKRNVQRRVSVTAIGIAKIQRYIRLGVRTVVAAGAAGFARAFIGVRRFVVTAVVAAALYVKIKQTILNRISGGGSGTYPDGLLRLRPDGRVEALPGGTGPLPSGAMRLTSVP